MQRIGIQIRLTVTEEQERRIARLAKKYGLKKAQVYRNMIDVGLDLHDDLEKMGFGKLMVFTDKVQEIFKEWRMSRQGRLF